MRSIWETARRFNRSTWLFLLYWATIGFCYFGVQAVLLNLYLLRLGYGLEFIGLLTGIGQAIWGLLALPAGAISGRIGLKRSMMVALLIISAAVCVQLGAESLPAGLQTPVLVAGSLSMWVGSAFIAVSNLPYLMAVTTPETRNYALSIQQAVMAIFGFTGSLLAGVVPGWVAGWMGVTLNDATPYRLTLLLVPAAYIACTLAFRSAQTIPPVARTVASGTKQAVPWGAFVFLTILFILQTSGEGTLRAFFNIYLDTELGMPTVQIGSIMALAALAPILAAGVAPALLIRRGANAVMLLAAVGSAVFLLLIALTPWWVAATACLFAANCLIALMSIGRSIFFQETVAPERRTMMAAIMTIGLATGWAVAAVSGGYLAGVVGFRGVFLLGAAGTLLSVVMLVAGAQPALAKTAGVVPVTSEQGEG